MHIHTSTIYTWKTIVYTCPVLFFHGLSSAPSRPKYQVRKTAFGSLDAVPHRHFEDPAAAVLSLRAAGAFVCALETTEGASSLFDVSFPLPPLVASRREKENDKNSTRNDNNKLDHDHNKVDNNRNNKGTPSASDEEIFDCLKCSGADSSREKGESGGIINSDAAAAVENVALQEGQNGGYKAGTYESAGSPEGVGDIWQGGPVVALVLGNEVTGVDERVLKICDLVVEVKPWWCS